MNEVEMKELVTKTRLYLEDNLPVLCSELHEYEISFDESKIEAINKLANLLVEGGFDSEGSQMQAFRLIKDAAVRFTSTFVNFGK